MALAVHQRDVSAFSGVCSAGCHDGYHTSSHIVSIKSSNIAGMTSDEDDTDIEVDFGSEPCLIAVTGER